MELTNKDEAYYRPTLEICKLLKDAGFIGKTQSFYSKSGEYIVGSDTDWNEFTDDYSAPLITIVLVWLKELGYYLNVGLEVIKRGEHRFADEFISPNIAKGLDVTKDERLINMLFIAACCKHRIETLKTK